MNTGIKRVLSFALISFACLASACSSDEIDKANRLINVGNAAVNEGNKLLGEATSKTDRIFDLVNGSQSSADGDSVKGLAQEAADGFEKSAAKYREAAAKFDEASKLQIRDNLKEYLRLTSQEFNKRAELSDTAKGTPQAFMDSESVEALQKTVLEKKDRVDKLEREADELAEKSNKIKQENKDIFKPDSR